MRKLRHLKVNELARSYDNEVEVSGFEFQLWPGDSPLYSAATVECVGAGLGAEEAGVDSPKSKKNRK